MTDPDLSPDFPLKEFFGFTIDRDDGVATASLELDDRHLNPNAVAHGAVAFTLMDTAMGGATMSVVPEGGFCATIEIQTRFHRPAMVGRLTATAEVVTAGKRIVHLSARTVDGEGNLVASATASYAVIEP